MNVRNDPSSPRKNVNRRFQNRVVINIFGWDVDGGWKILHIEELHKLYSLTVLG
jgi:hypothetical protein